MTRAEQLENAVNFALAIAADNSHGYDNRVNHNLGPDFDCGTFVSMAMNHAGILNGKVFEPNEEYGTAWSWGAVLYPAGFKKYPFSYGAVRRGDILIKNGHHTELAISGYQTVGAHDNYDGRPGDWGTGNEIGIANISWGYWDYILRLDTGSEPAPAPVAVDYIQYGVQEDINKLYLPLVINDTDYAGLFGSDIIAIAARLSTGDTLHLKAHLWEGEEGEWYGNPIWLPDVTGFNWCEPENGFAGDGRPIDAMTAWCDNPKIEVLMRSHGRKTNRWYEWVSSFQSNIKDPEYGYAGVIGEPMDGLQMKIKVH